MDFFALSCHSVRTLIMCGMVTAALVVMGGAFTWARRSRHNAIIVAAVLYGMLAAGGVAYAAGIIPPQVPYPDQCTIYQCSAANCGFVCWWYWCACD